MLSARGSVLAAAGILLAASAAAAAACCRRGRGLPSPAAAAPASPSSFGARACACAGVSSPVIRRVARKCCILARFHTRAARARGSGGPGPGRGSPPADGLESRGSRPCQRPPVPGVYISDIAQTARALEATEGESGHALPPLAVHTVVVSFPYPCPLPADDTFSTAHFARPSARATRRMSDASSAEGSPASSPSSAAATSPSVAAIIRRRPPPLALACTAATSAE